MLKLLLSVGLLCTSFSMDNQNAKAIIGVWKAEAIENSSIELYEAEDGLLYGKIVDSSEKDWIGKVIFSEGTYDAEANHWQGELYSLKRKMTIAATLSLESDKKLKVVGKKFFMTKTFYWER
ncbi:MAG: DUF2147 domain-containing protein [Bacteroidota bacterium]